MNTYKFSGIKDGKSGELLLNAGEAQWNSSDENLKFTEYDINFIILKDETHLQILSHKSSAIIFKNSKSLSEAIKSLNYSYSKNKLSSSGLREYKNAIMLSGAIILSVVGLITAVRYYHLYLAPIPPLEAELTYISEIDEIFKKDVYDLEHDYTKKIRALAQVLFQANPTLKNDFKLFVIKSETANAFTTFGKRIYFTDKFLTQAGSAEEILGVLAHEIGHAEHRHVMRNRMAENYTRVLSIIFNSGSIGALDYITSLEYSRRFETEADQAALKYLKMANISPHGIIDFFQRKDVDDSFEWLSTHPGAKDRVLLFKSQLKEEAQYKLLPDIKF